MQTPCRIVVRERIADEAIRMRVVEPHVQRVADLVEEHFDGLMALIQTSAAGWASSHFNTLDSGTGRMSSDTTFVSSRIIQREGRGMWEVDAAGSAWRSSCRASSSMDRP